MREVASQGKTGMQWTLTTQLHDLDYADDICLLSQNLQHMQIKTEYLALVAEKTGLRISKEKTKTMRANSKRLKKIKLEDKELEDVHICTYLWGVITSEGGSDEDVRSRIGKARRALTPQDQCGTQHQYPLKPSYESLLPMWSQFFFMVPIPGESQDPYPTSYKPSLINVWERS